MAESGRTANVRYGWKADISRVSASAAKVYLNQFGFEACRRA